MIWNIGDPAWLLHLVLEMRPEEASHGRWMSHNERRSCQALALKVTCAASLTELPCTMLANHRNLGRYSQITAQVQQ